TTDSDVVDVGLLAAIGNAESLATVSSRTEAFAGALSGVVAGTDAAGINVGSGQITVQADAVMTAISDIDGGGFGALKITLFEPTAKVDGATRAYVRDGVDIDAGNLSIQAGKDGNRIDFIADASTSNGSFSLIGTYEDLQPTATVSAVVEAFVGASTDTVGGGNPTADIVLTNVSKMVIQAWGNFDADATVKSGGGSLGVKVNSFSPLADAGGATRAFINDGADLGSLDLRLLADGYARADAVVESISLSGVADISILSPIAKVTSLTETYAGRNVDEITNDAAIIWVGNIDADARSKTIANSTAEGFGFTAGVKFGKTTVISDASGATRAYVGKNTTLNAGSIDLRAEELDLTLVDDGVEAMANSSLGDFGAGGIAQISLLDATATASRETEAFVGNNSFLNLGAHQLKAVADTVMANPMAQAFIDSGTGAGIANVKDMKVVAVVGSGSEQDSATRSYIGAGSTINAGEVILKALSDTEASATVDSIGAAGIADIQITDITATTAHDTETYVGDGSILTLSGGLTMLADSKVSASPSSGSFSFGGALSLGVTTIKTTLDSDTNAYIGDGATVSTPTLSMRAEGEHVGNANISQTNVSGLVSISSLTATVEDKGSVNVGIGADSGSGSTVTVTGTDGVDAPAFDVDAYLKSTVTSESSGKSFSLGGGDAFTKTVVLNEAQATGLIGDNVNLSANNGSFDMLVNLDGLARAKATSVGGGAFYGGGGASADVDFDASVDVSVGDDGSIYGKFGVDLAAWLNYDGVNKT
ncbi:MAG: hypothetical protein JRD04_12720, partial [Deltaproteobacteria bacterium]|nr:hypothetical protein [Deltaproteobacteria bacterium]